MTGAARRVGQAAQRAHWPGHLMSWRAELIERRDELRRKFESYDGGDRPMSPPVSLMRELAKVEAELDALPEEEPK